MEADRTTECSSARTVEVLGYNVYVTETKRLLSRAGSHDKLRSKRTGGVLMELLTVKIKKPTEVNVIFGQAHFILVRTSGTSKEMIALAEANALAIAAGHTFLIFLANAFPVNVLNAVKMVPEVCRVYCATANPVEVILAKTDQGRGVLGVIDGEAPKGVETEYGAAQYDYRCAWHSRRSRT